MTRTINVGGTGMLGLMGMQRSRREKAHTGTKWPSLYHWERHGSRRADGPGKMEWRIHRPGYWHTPRQMYSCFEE